MKQLTLLLFAITAFLFFRNLLLMIFHMENIRSYKKRLRQLKLDREGKSEEADILDSLTKPIIDIVFPKLKINDFEKVGKELKFVGWKIDAKKFIALKILLKVIGVVFFVLLSFSMEKGVMIGLVWMCLLSFLPQILLTNSFKNKRERLLLEFPDFIRISQGYLTAGMPFDRAVREAATFLNEDWQELLKKFLARIKVDNIDDALEFLKEEIGTLEVKEFVSIVRLTLEQGGKAKDGFEAQAEKIQEMLYDMMLIKINRRKIYGIIIQAPLLLVNFAVLGLPVADTFMNMGI